MPSGGVRAGVERVSIGLLIVSLGACLLPVTPGRAWLMAFALLIVGLGACLLPVTPDRAWLVAFAAGAATAVAVIGREERHLTGRAGPRPGSISGYGIPDLIPRGSRLTYSTASRAPPLPA